MFECLSSLAGSHALRDCESFAAMAYLAKVGGLGQFLKVTSIFVLFPLPPTELWHCAIPL